MNDDFVWSISSILAFTVLMTFCYFMVMSIMHQNKKKKYDERQILARNQAYKASYIFLLLYLTVCLALERNDIKWATFQTIIFIGIFISITIFAMICILKQAYIFNNRKNNPYDFLFRTFFLGIMYLIVFFADLEKGESVFTNGMLNGNIANLLFAILFLGMFIAKLIIDLKKKTEKEE